MDHCEVQSYYLKDDGSIPNNRLPLVVYRNCLHQGTEQIRQLLESHGWADSWVNGIYDFHHYHSTAHECLVVLEGTAVLAMGGEQGVNITVTQGDVLILPAGTGHKRVKSDSSFKVLGAYPDGQKWDLLKDEAEERPRALENIQSTALPSQDPVYGEDGKLKILWGD